MSLELGTVSLLTELQLSQVEEYFEGKKSSKKSSQDTSDSTILYQQEQRISEIVKAVSLKDGLNTLNRTEITRDYQQMVSMDEKRGSRFTQLSTQRTEEKRTYPTLLESLSCSDIDFQPYKSSRVEFVQTAHKKTFSISSTADLTNVPKDCSLTAYSQAFQTQYEDCLSRYLAQFAMDDGAACIAQASIDALNGMYAQCKSHLGPQGQVDCSIGGYAVAALEHIDLEEKIIHIVTRKVENKIASALGCAVGAAIGGGVAFAITEHPIAASLGGAVGCKAGKHIANYLWKSYKIITTFKGDIPEGLLMLNMSTQTNVKTSKLGIIGGIRQMGENLIDHSAACEATPDS